MVKNRTVPLFGRDLKVAHDELAVFLYERALAFLRQTGAPVIVTKMPAQCPSQNIYTV